MTDPQSQQAEEDTIRPLGTPTDPLRPTGRVAHAVPRAEGPAPRPKRSRRDQVWLGVTLAVGGLALWFIAWSLVSAALEEVLGMSWHRAYERVLPWSVAIGAAYAVGVSSYAVRTRSSGILAGFWGAMGAIALLILVLKFLVVPGTLFGA